jgi:predicted aspartyl protease
VLVEVEGENVFAYLDTGATFHVMSQRLVEKIGLQPHVELKEAPTPRLVAMTRNL